MKNSYKETDINLTLAANECLEVKIDYRIQPAENDMLSLLLQLL